MSSKNIWRTRMLDKRYELGPDKIAELNRQISKNLSFVWTEGGGLGNPKSKPLWVSYKSFRWESDPTQALIDADAYLRFAYPRISGDSKMDFYIPASTDGRWLKNSWGIWEPDPLTSEKVNLTDVVGILVPGVAFDRHGQRLGYGKGFYDKALVGFKGLKVGVAYSVQITDEDLPADDFDVLMDLIVTDKEIIRVSQSRH